MSVPDSSEETLRIIFSSILNAFLVAKKFPKEIIELGESNKVVLGTLNMYANIQKELLPTPMKSHYVFNLRDVSKVFQGILSAMPQTVHNVELFAKLWIHENLRVFHDRLIS